MQELIKSYYTFNGLCLFIVCVILTPDTPQVRYTSTAYVEDYNFDAPEGMDLMIHRHSRDPGSLDVQQDCKRMWLLCVRLCYMSRGTSGI